MVDIDLTIIPIIILCVCLIGIVFSLFMLHRNHQVFNERTKVSAKVFEKDRNGDYIWSKEIFRLTSEMESITTYDQMMHLFWKKPDSFYKEFLENLEKEKTKIKVD